MLEVERKPVGTQIDAALPGKRICRHEPEGLVGGQVRKDDDPEALAQVSDDGDAGALHTQLGDVHAQHLTVGGDRLRCPVVQKLSGVEESCDRRRIDPTSL